LELLESQVRPDLKVLQVSKVLLELLLFLDPPDLKESQDLRVAMVWPDQPDPKDPKDPLDLQALKVVRVSSVQPDLKEHLDFLDSKDQSDLLALLDLKDSPDSRDPLDSPVFKALLEDKDPQEHKVHKDSL